MEKTKAKFYRLGKYDLRKRDWPENERFFGLDYTPDSTKYAIHIWEGGPGGAGSGATIEEAISGKWAEHFSLAGVEWFRPILEKISKGESISIEVICQEYRKRYGIPPQTFESRINPELDSQ